MTTSTLEREMNNIRVAIDLHMHVCFVALPDDGGQRQRVERRSPEDANEQQEDKESKQIQSAKNTFASFSLSTD